MNSTNKSYFRCFEDLMTQIQKKQQEIENKQSDIKKLQAEIDNIKRNIAETWSRLIDNMFTEEGREFFDEFIALCKRHNQDVGDYFDN